MTQFDWLEWAVVLLGIGLFILGGLLMQVLGETERQKQYVDTHAHQLKRLTSLVRHLETQNKELLGQKSENDDDEDDSEEKDSDQTTTLDDLLNKTEKT
tara:strand:+ start:192 stop:488 length:297 start_codon:yes stop_codon:yes gene_type:complete